MIEWIKFIEELELLHKMLTVAEPKDDDPDKIFTRGKIRELIAKYKKQLEQFDKWADEEAEKDASRGGTVV